MRARWPMRSHTSWASARWRLICCRKRKGPACRPWCKLVGWSPCLATASMTRRHLWKPRSAWRWVRGRMSRGKAPISCCWGMTWPNLSRRWPSPSARAGLSGRTSPARWPWMRWASASPPAACSARCSRPFCTSPPSCSSSSTRPGSCRPGVPPAWMDQRRRRERVCVGGQRRAPGLFEVGMHDVNQFFGALGAFRVGLPGRINDVHADVVLHHLGHQAVDRATGGGDETQHFRTAHFRVQRAFDGLHLAANAAYAMQQLGLLGNRVSHGVASWELWRKEYTPLYSLVDHNARRPRVEQGGGPLPSVGNVRGSSEATHQQAFR